MGLAGNILSTVAARLVVLALALTSSVLLARVLGPEGRGVFALTLLLPELLATFGLLGVEQANAVYTGLEPGKRVAIVWQSALTALIVGGLFSLAGGYWFAIGAPGLTAKLSGPTWLYLLPLATLPARLLVEYWTAVLRGMNRILLVNTFETLTKVVSLALVVILVAWLKLGVAGAVWANVTLTAAQLLLVFGLLVREGVWAKPAVDWVLWKRSLRFAVPAYCASVAGYLHYRLDQIIVAVLLPADQLAFYVIAVDIAERLWIITGAAAAALLPHLTNSPERDPALSAVVTRHVLLWTASGCLAAFGIAGVAVRTLYSADFDGVVAPFRWLLPGILVSVVWKVLCAEMLAREKVDYTVWVTGAATVVNLMMNLALVPRMGISGAALSSSISYSLMSFMMSWYYLRETGVPWTSLVPRRTDVLTYSNLLRRTSHGIP